MTRTHLEHLDPSTSSPKTRRSWRTFVFSLGRALGLCTLCLIGGCSALLYVFSDPLPEVSRRPEELKRAEALIDRMEAALNVSAWRTAEGARWCFMSQHCYVWHKRLGRVRVKLNDEVMVYLDTATQRGFALYEGAPLDEEARAGYVADAITAFNNDSFWLLAPFKARDVGTQRALVSGQAQREGAEGREGVLVYYTSGGSTPGDSYLWRFDERGRPASWRVWAQILPVKGVLFSWEGWEETASGAWVARVHSAPVGSVTLDEIEIASRYSELGVEDAYLTSPRWAELISPLYAPSSQETTFKAPVSAPHP